MLNTFMQSQFEATIQRFENAKLSEQSPLHGLMGVSFVNAPPPNTASQNISSISTSYYPEKMTEVRTPEQTAQAPVYGDADTQKIVQKASQEYGVPVALINAVIKQESNFNPKAQSHAGAQGLMQLMPSTAKAYGCHNSFDPEQNIMAGTKFLGDLLAQYKGDVTLSLAGYNAGPGNVAKYGNTVPPFRETQDYVVKVGDYYKANLTAMEKSGQRFSQMEDSPPKTLSRG
ncbi:MAG: lytic transglycosylase domain-containing protein [Deltaproteobacteria bacterium]|nr:lytic transglycosylase domain-containing protein [Deltaproteobacteria bacterium]